MDFETTTTLSTSAHEMISAISQAGGRPFEVGGCVRDSLLGIPCKDIDIEVFTIDANKLRHILAQFGTVKLVGASFGVLKLKHKNGTEYDFSLPRTDNKTGPGHKGFSVNINPDMSTEQAASRRDFTVNAMSRNCISGCIIDHFGGINDLKSGILRATGSKFKEDPLRVLRGFQFAARFNMHVETTTANLCRQLRSEYQTLAKERIWNEWFKWAAKGNMPSHGLTFLVDTGWIENYPELQALIGVPQDPKWHPEGDVWNHTKFVCDAAADIANQNKMTPVDKATLVLAALCHDLGKATTTAMIDGRWRARGHSKEGVTLSAAFLHSIGCPQHIQSIILPLVQEHLVHTNSDISQKTVRRLSNRLEKATIAQLVHLIEADMNGRPPLAKGLPNSAKQLIALADELALAAASPQPIIGGKHLLAHNLQPGPFFGNIINQCFEAQLDGKFNNESQAREFLANLLKQ